MRLVAAFVCLAVLAGAGCSGGGSTAQRGDRLHKGDKAPAFSLRDMVTDEAFDFGKDFFKNKATVVTFWSMACPVCREGLLEVQKVQEKYAPVGVVFVGVNFDVENLQGVRAYVKGEGIAFPTLMDQGRRVTRKYKALDYSFSVFVVDDQGMVILAQYDHPPDLYDVLAKALDPIVGDLLE